MDRKEIVFVCAQNICRPELELQGLLSSMTVGRKTELGLCRYEPKFLPHM